MLSRVRTAVRKVARMRGRLFEDRIDHWSKRCRRKKEEEEGKAEEEKR
jgi:hypothetical protein